MHHLLVLSLLLQPSFSLAQLIATDTLTTTLYAILTPSIIRLVSFPPYLLLSPSQNLTSPVPEQNNYSSSPLRGPIPISFPTGLPPNASHYRGGSDILIVTTNSSVTPKSRIALTSTTILSLANSTSTHVSSATETGVTSGKGATATATAGGARVAEGKKGAAVMAVALGGVAGGMIGWG